MSAIQQLIAGLGGKKTLKSPTQISLPLWNANTYALNSFAIAKSGSEYIIAGGVAASGNVGPSTTTNILRSTDLSSWNLVTTPSGIWKNAFYNTSTSTFIITGSNGSTQSSSNGVSWDVSPNGLPSITATENGNINVTSDGTYEYIVIGASVYKRQGNSAIATASPGLGYGPPSGMGAIAVGGGRLVLTPTGSGSTFDVWVCTNLSTLSSWSKVTINGSVGHGGSVYLTYGGGYFWLSVPNGGASGLYKSTDGNSWEVVSYSNLPYLLIYKNGTLFGVNNVNGPSAVIYSEDGINWNSVSINPGTLRVGCIFKDTDGPLLIVFAFNYGSDTFTNVLYRLEYS